MSFFRLFLVCIITFTASSSLAANQSIIAVVDNKAITSYDLEERIKLVIATSNIPQGVDVEKRVKPQVLRAMIDETLQLKEAEKMGINITPQEIENAIATLEKRNGTEAGGLMRFIAEKGASPKAMTEQLKAQIAWNKIVMQKIRPRVRVSDEEVNQAMETVVKQSVVTEYQISEIVIPVDSPDMEKIASDLANRIKNDINGGVAFATLAEEVAMVATTPSTNEVVRWVSPEILDEEIKKFVMLQSSTTLPSRTELIKTNIGFHIVRVEDKRSSSVNGNEDINEIAEQQQIREQMFARKMDLEVRKFMRNMRKSALIEIRG